MNSFKNEQETILIHSAKFQNGLVNGLSLSLMLWYGIYQIIASI